MAKFGEIARRDVQRFISLTLAVAEINTAWLNLPSVFKPLKFKLASSHVDVSVDWAAGRHI